MCLATYCCQNRGAETSIMVAVPKHQAISKMRFFHSFMASKYSKKLMSHPRAIIEILRYPKNLNMFGQLGFSPQKSLHRLKKIPAPKKMPLSKSKKSFT